MRKLLMLGAAVVVCVGGVASFAGDAAALLDEFFDSPLDGVWVGSIAVKSDDGTLQRPLLLNLDVGADGVRGVALAADSMIGAPSAIVPLELSDGAVKGKKLSFRLTTTDDDGDRHFDFVVRNRRGALRGIMKSNADGIAGKSRLELLPVDVDAPYQHLWIGEMDGAVGARRSAGIPVALFLNGDGKFKGAGLVGELSGSVKGATVTDAGIDVTLATQEGDVDLSLAETKAGLEGTADGAADGKVELFRGGVDATVKLGTAGPGELPAGQATEVTLRGKNLPDGSLLHVDHPDVFGESSPAAKGKTRTVSVVVGKDVDPGTELRLRLVTPDGDLHEVKKALRSGEGSGGVSFSLDLQPIFAQSCALTGCHVKPDLDDPAYGENQDPAGNLTLVQAQAYAQLVNTPAHTFPGLLRVEPGNPDDSYLIRKLRGVGIEGSRMPLGGPYLSDAQIQMFVDWILAGAPRS